jgi:hypothetical protein
VPLLLALVAVLASCNESPGPAATAVAPGVVASFTPTSAPLPSAAPAIAPSPTDPSATPVPSPSAAPGPTPVPAPAATPSPTAIPTRPPTATPTPAPTLTPTPYPSSQFVLPGFTRRYVSFQPAGVHFIRDFPDGIGAFVHRAVLEGRVRYGGGTPEIDLLWRLDGYSAVEWRFVLVDETAYLSVVVDGVATGWVQSSANREVMNRVTAMLPPLATLLSWEFIENGPWERLDGAACGGASCHRFSQSFDDRQVILAVDEATLRPASLAVRSGPADGRYTRATTEFVAWDAEPVLAPPGVTVAVEPARLAYEFFWPLVLLGIESDDAGSLSLLDYLNTYLP